MGLSIEWLSEFIDAFIDDGDAKEESVRYIKQRGYFLKDGWIFGYFDSKYITVLRIEQIFHHFEDQKSDNFFNLEQVNFCMTLVNHYIIDKET